MSKYHKGKEEKKANLYMSQTAYHINISTNVISHYMVIASLMSGGGGDGAGVTKPVTTAGVSVTNTGGFLKRQ